jgi:hypothetical protein
MFDFMSFPDFWQQKVTKTSKYLKNGLHFIRNNGKSRLCKIVCA